MVCQMINQVLGSNLSWADYLIYPTTCFYYFYAVILGAVFLIVMLWLYNREREVSTQPDIISTAAISATAIFVLAGVGTLVRATNYDIPLIQSDIFMYVFAFWIVLSAIWFFKE